MSRKTLWCWREIFSPDAYGPFTSYRQAIQDAYHYIYKVEKSTQDKVFILVGKCHYANPVKTLQQAIDLKDILEDMDTIACDNAEGNPNDITFTPQPSLLEAEKSLNRLLKQWTRNHIKVEYFVTYDEKEVLLRKGEL